MSVAGQGTTTFEPLPSGKPHRLVRPDGSTSTTEYDEAGRIASIVHARAGVAIAELAYAYDANGNRIEQRERNGAVTGDAEQVTTYAYDQADRLTGHAGPDREVTYTLDAVGNRTTEQVRIGGVLASDSTLSYNARDQLTERDDPVRGLHVELDYDANGNVRSQTDASGTRSFSYDARDRLLTLAQPNAPPLGFDYQSDGLRLAKRQGGSETRYQYDQQSLLAETNAIGNTLVRYHYGATQLASRTEAGGTPTHRHYLLDALGTPIGLLTPQGAVSARTRYDAWGAILAQQAPSGTVTTPDPDGTTADLASTDAQAIGFTGYVKDPESGLYYARARYYDPRLARFTTQDPERGDTLQPPSLHRYLYAYANPAVYVDPDGRCGTPVLSPVECEQMQLDQAAVMTGIDPSTPEGYQAASEFQVGRATGQMRGAWNAVKDTAQFAADIPGSVVDLIPGVDVGSLGRMGERARGLWDFVRSPMQTIKADVQAHEAAYVGALEAGDYRGAGQMHGEVEGGIGAGAVMSYAGAGVSSLVRGSRLARVGDQQRLPALVAEGASGEPVSRMPSWLRERFKEGDDFNRRQAAKYPYNEVYVEPSCAGGNCLRLDSYNPTAGGGTGEIVSRKHTQLAEIKAETASGYLREIERKYPPGTRIADVPTNRASGLAGDRLRGQMYLEVPTQNTPVPQALLGEARARDIRIRDEHGNEL